MLTLDFLLPVSLSNKMRLGPNEDGGYVVYKPSLYKIDLLLTYGVGWDIDFEIDFYNLTGKKILMYDPTLFGDKGIDRAYCAKLVKKWRVLSEMTFVRKTCVLHEDISMDEFDYPTQGLDYPNSCFRKDFDKLSFF